MAWDTSQSPRRLVAAADALDRPQVDELCASLVAHLESSAEPYPLVGAKMLLDKLRSKRYFTQLRQLADAFIRTGADQPAIRRHYAQTLIELGELVAAEAYLREFVADTTVRGTERDEARGLLGRAYKQAFVASSPAMPDRRRALLERAIGQYRSAYRDSGDGWPGVNAVALLKRAERDRIAIGEDPGAEAEQLARDILRAAEATGDQQAWDFANAMEACLALGRLEEARQWLDAYVAKANAFEIGSTLRQLTEIWELDVAVDPGAQLLPVLETFLVAREGGPDLVVGAAEISRSRLERLARDASFQKVLGNDGFFNLQWFHTALERCRAVARIENRVEDGIGSGFLVAGADLHADYPPVVLITNSHVVPDTLDPRDAAVTFRALEGERVRHEIKDVLDTWPPDDLDTTILELETYPEDAGCCPLARRKPLRNADPPAQTYVIGHPTGTTDVLFSLRDNLLLDWDDRVVHYRTPTLGGNSGSPVFNRSWEVLAVHHAGLEKMPRLRGADGTYPANEGIWLERIRQALTDRRPGPQPRQAAEEQH
jgi:hypothetical protein